MFQDDRVPYCLNYKCKRYLQFIIALDSLNGSSQYNLT